MSTISNIVNAGNASANASVKAYKAAREYSPKYDDIAEASIKARANEKIAAFKADATVAKAGLDANQYVKRERIKRDTERDIRGIKKPAKQMKAVAGVVGAASLMLKKDKPENSIYKAAVDKEIARLQALRDKPHEYDKPDTGYLDTLTSQLNGLQPPTRDGTRSSTPGSSTPTPTGKKSGGEISMQYMNTLTSKGYTPEQAAALVGHLRVETGDFKHMEELAPNRYGTKGYGHLQWTNTGEGQGRRTNFLNWTKGQGLDPTSFEGNSGFLLHEMETNHGGVWTNGGSAQGLKGTSSIADASRYLHDNYIRPSEGSRDRRITLGQETLAQWQSLNS